MIPSLQVIAVIAIIVGLSGAYLYQSVPMIPWVCGGVAVAALVAYIWLDRKRLKERVTHRSTLFGLNAVFKAVLILGIATVANLIFVNYDWKWDATKNKLHTLSDQSVKVVKSLQKPITIRAFVNPQATQDYKDIFGRYQHESDKVKVEFMDVLKDPLMAKTYNVVQLDTILVEGETRTARVEGLAGGAQDPKIEEKLTNAIIQSSKGTKKKAYFLTGHGERSITDGKPDSLSEIKAVMQEGRYDVNELKFASSEKVPQDAEILIIAGPKSEFMPFEIQAIEEFLLQRGGNVLLMLDPDSPPSFQGFLAKFGVDWKTKKAVVELNALRRSANANPVIPFIEKYSTTHPITKEARMPTILQLATPMEKASKVPEGYTVEDLFSSSEVSFEVAFQGNRLSVNEKTDKRGPLHIAYAITGKSAAPNKEEKKDEKTGDVEKNKLEAGGNKSFRMVVVGDSDFPMNGIRAYGMNSDLFMNMLSWLSSEEGMISLMPRPLDSAKMDLSEFKVRVVQLASMIFAPLGMFALAIGVWLFRRRQ